MAGEDVGGKATAVALARGVDLVRVDAVLFLEGVDHVQGEPDIVAFGRWVALPLVVYALRVDDEHVRVLGWLGELAESLLLGGGLGAAVEGEDQSVGHVLVIVGREVQEEVPLDSLGRGEVDLVALACGALLQL